MQPLKSEKSEANEDTTEQPQILDIKSKQKELHDWSKNSLTDMVVMDEVSLRSKFDGHSKVFFENIWDLRRANGNEFLVYSEIFVCCKSFIFPTKKTRANALSETKYKTHRVYRVRKCSIGGKSSRKCCVFFVDENGRVYKDWEDFKSNHSYGGDVLVIPKNGYYDKLDNGDEIDLEIHSNISKGLAEKLNWYWHCWHFSSSSASDGSCTDRCDGRNRCRHLLRCLCRCSECL